MAPTDDKAISTARTQLTEASELFANGDEAKGSAMAVKALDSFRGAGDAKGVQEALMVYAGPLLASEDPNDFNEAARITADEVEHFRKAGDKNAEALLLSCLAEVYLFGGDVDEALKNGYAAQEIFQELRDAAAEATVLNTVAVAACMLVGENKMALDIANMALSLAIKSGKKDVEADVWMSIGKARFALAEQNFNFDGGDPVNAVNMAPGLYREAGSKKGEMLALQSMADLRVKMAKAPTISAKKRQLMMQEASIDVENSLILAEQVGSKKNVSDITKLFCDTYNEAGQKDRALMAAEKRLRECKDAGDKEGEAAIVGLVVMGRFSTGDADRALELANASVELFHELDDLNGEAAMWAMMAQGCIEGGNVQGAKQASLTAGRIFKQIGDEAAAARANEMFNFAFRQKSSNFKENAHIPLYWMINLSGLAYGPRYRNNKTVFCGQHTNNEPEVNAAIAGKYQMDRFAYSALQLTSEAQEWEHTVLYHPGLLDAALHVSFGINEPMDYAAVKKTLGPPMW
eukprot:gnl/TRDRNA2_/TRDRNA2_185308_c0_seq1.p1 gnl/TRDRNA2_/TRDRNA2_185308_c0~~gnl/TRDRNA2_/TRDRNA2_185308_c0_seq1.p1  ORF type:complete len:536 (+),score=136.37 gnl/TRDRNA2_/TRDRNA2_185308_c0_seq1:52-1608(+)